MSFRLGSCRITVGYEAIAAITAVILLDGENRIIRCVAAALLHELGHLLMMRLCGVRVRGITLRLFDVQIAADSPDSFRHDVWITLGGPMVNLLFAAVLVPAGSFFGLAHLALGCFNLLPAASLDGGRLFYLLLSRRFDERVCVRAVQIVSFILLLPLMTAGIYLLFQSGYNYSLLIVSLYLTAVLFLKS